MWELNYAREPLDFKFMLLMLFKKIGILLWSTVGGALLVGGAYYLSNVTLAGPSQYETTSSYYIEYGTDPQTDSLYTYINGDSWRKWVVSDWFVDRVWDKALLMGMNPQQYGIEKSDLLSFLTADLPTDLRVATATVRTTNADLTEQLNRALQDTFSDFADEQKEIDTIKVVNTTQVRETIRGERLPQAGILGAISGICIGLLALLLWFFWQDSESIYLPETFTYRYGVPMLGAGTGTGSKMELTEGSEENIKYVYRDREKIAVTAVDPEIDLKAVTSLLPAANYLCVPSILQVPEAVEYLRDADAILLLVKAEAGNTKQIEHLLHDLRIQDCKVDGALLYQADESLLKAYRLPGAIGKPREKTK